MEPADTASRNRTTPREDLAALLATHRAEKTIVFTNGCFDILHVGHVRYLEAARALGDCLVVGVNSDDSVRRLKGQRRPILPQHERAELLASLRCVDYVVIFPEDTPIDTIQILRPDIHVKGGDYQTDDLPETPYVQSYGGRVVCLPFVPGQSTTGLVERILEAYR